MTTANDLAKKSRGELDEHALELGIDPSEYSNRELLTDAILTVLSDVPEEGGEGTEGAAKDEPEAEEKRLEVAGRLEHTGKWIVKSGIKYTSKKGETLRANEYSLGEDGQVEKDEKGKPLPNLIDDIPFATAEDLYRRGVLEPHLS